ncbi:MAG: hypothetical protein K6F61_02110 [Clostridiales bacterium]|nr:hypothetical protein [Clostridiales bacterium]
MRRNYRGNMLLAALLVLVMLLCSFPTVYAKDAAAETAAAEQEYTPETGPESLTAASEAAAEPVPEEESEPENVPEEEPVQESGPAEVPEEEPAAEPDPAESAEEEPAAEPDPAEIPEGIPEESVTETDAEIEAEAETEEESIEDAGEESSDGTLYEFDDDETGSVSRELLEIFNNPETYERIEFSGTVDIELKNGELCWDRDVTLVARVSGADMDYRLVWEANDGSGWFAVASGDEYTFLLTPGIVNREYRVVLFRVC